MIPYSKRLPRITKDIIQVNKKKRENFSFHNITKKLNKIVINKEITMKRLCESNLRVRKNKLREIKDENKVKIHIIIEFVKPFKKR